VRIDQGQLVAFAVQLVFAFHARMHGDDICGNLFGRQMAALNQQ
jgi:hypothetical protein